MLHSFNHAFVVLVQNCNLILIFFYQLFNRNAVLHLYGALVLLELFL